MKKLSLLFFLFVPMFAYAVSVQITGEGRPSPNQTYSYNMLSTHGVSGTKAKWTVSGGTFWDGSTTLEQIVDITSVNVKWGSGQMGVLNYYYKNGSGAAYEGSITVSIQGNSGGTGGTVGTGKYFKDLKLGVLCNGVGKFNTFESIRFNLSYTSNHNLGKQLHDIKVEWYIDNYSKKIGNPCFQTFDKPGTYKVRARLCYKIYGNGGTSDSYHQEVSTVVTITDGYLAVPDLTGIQGPANLGIRTLADYKPLPNYSAFYPDGLVKYDWELRYYATSSVKQTGYNFRYTFNEATYYVLFCTATNTRTGKSGNRANLTIVVSSPGLRSMEVADNQYEVLNVPDAVIVTQAVNNHEISIVKSNKSISYQIHNLLTGVLFDKGTVQDGGGIDTSHLPKGMYVLTLDDGTKIETHKMAIR